MRFRLAAALALVVGIDYVEGECSSSMTQLNETICTWQGIRGKCAAWPQCIFGADHSSQRRSGYDLYGWWSNMASAV
jgi:hypothetical protein